MKFLKKNSIYRIIVLMAFWAMGGIYFYDSLMAQMPQDAMLQQMRQISPGNNPPAGATSRTNSSMAEKEKVVEKAVESKVSIEPDASSADLITVNFENVDIRDCMKILAEKARVNVVVGPDVVANVNMQLTSVTWEKALEIILKTYNLTYRKEGDLLRVMTVDQMRAEDEKLPLETKIVLLNFAKAADVKTNFENMLSTRGKIAVNDRTNSLIITDLPVNIAQIEEIVVKLDSRTPQVVIEALMADVVISQDDQLGVNWDLTWPDTIADGSSNVGRVPKRSIEQNLGALAAPGGIIKFGTTLLTDKDLRSTIVAWQQQSRVNILAHPQVMTLDNLPAKINLTEEIPYQQQTTSTESSSAVVSTAFKEAGITLSVTPHITTKDDYIYLSIDVKQSFRSGFTPDNQPIIDSRSATTNLLVRDKETAIIGGLRKKNDTFAVNKLPLLGDLPLVGGAFRKRVQAVNDTDLMIFVTPTIVREINLTNKEKDRLRLFDEETSDWATQFDQVRKKKASTATTQSNDKKMIETKDKFYLRPPLLHEENQ